MIMWLTEQTNTGQATAWGANKLRQIFFLYLDFYLEHSRITGLQGKGETISLTPLYHFHPLHRYLDISRAIIADSSILHITTSSTRTGTVGFWAQVANN